MSIWLVQIDKYSENEAHFLDQSRFTSLLKLKCHFTTDAIKDLGNLTEIAKVFVGFQRHLYEDAV